MYKNYVTLGVQQWKLYNIRLFKNIKYGLKYYQNIFFLIFSLHESSMIQAYIYLLSRNFVWLVLWQNTRRIRFFKLVVLNLQIQPCPKIKKTLYSKYYNDILRLLSNLKSINFVSGTKALNHYISFDYSLIPIDSFAHTFLLSNALIESDIYNACVSWHTKYLSICINWTPHNLRIALFPKRLDKFIKMIKEIGGIRRH